MTNTPKLKVPFQIKGKSAAVVEQDSPEEIEQCVSAIVRTRVGSRLDRPEFGVPDVTFRSGSARPELGEAIDEWEPRARYFIEEESIEDMVQRIHVNINERD
jgi:phage baseplate assembly protein W